MLVSLAHAALKLVGSLWLTVAILIVLVFILLGGTVVYKVYGATAAKFGIFGTWWFNGLGLILGFNSAAALVRRWPWKLSQMGFVVPHIGLIVLLVGCALSRRYGIEATVSVFEGESSDLAYTNSTQYVELDGLQQFRLKVIPSDGETRPGGPIVVPFTSGPFNWDDFHNGKLFFLPWSLAHRDQGVIYDQDGIRLEVLDYLSNSEIVNLPSLRVQATPLGPDGRELSEQAEDYRFSITTDAGPHSDNHGLGIGSEQKLAGRRILFWMSGSAEETTAFLQSKPAGPLGKLGRIVLYAGGKSYDWAINDMAPGTRRALGDSGLEAEFVDVREGQVGIRGDAAEDIQVRLQIHRNSVAHLMVLSAAFPQVFNRQDYDDKVFGAFWPGQPEKAADPPRTKPEEKPAALPAKDASQQAAAPAKTESTAKAEATKPDAKTETATASTTKPGSEPEAPPMLIPPHIDFFQGADQQLYLRTWRAGQVVISRPLKMGRSGGRITAFRDTPDAVVLRFSDFQPADRPGFSARGLDFDSDDVPHLRQARVRLTVDDQSDEFWIPCFSPDPLEKKALSIPRELQQKTVSGKRRRVELSFAPRSFELGYSIFLNKAWRKLDPGTHKPSFFGSEIDLVPNEHAIAYGLNPDDTKNLLVTLNAPLDFADPAMPGRSYRMFQSTMPGPYNPEDFDRKPGESVYISGFTLNYDPGRGLTYVGCLLIVAGIFVAYFVRLVVPKRLEGP